MNTPTPRFCFEFQRRVEFHETDLAGIVHFSNFYRYMETAEHAFLRSLGHSIHEQVGTAEIGWPRVSARCEFKRPVRYDDVLTIRVAIEEIRTRSVRYGFRFHVDPEAPPVAEGEVAVACVRFDGSDIKAIPIPDAVRTDLEAAMQSQ